MITNNDKKIIEEIRKHFDNLTFVSETEIDWDKVRWIETFDRLVNLLKIAPESYRFCTPEDIKNNYYTAECDECGWWGSSKLLDGGNAIADTGDYSDCSCPVCGNYDIDEKSE